jgi:tripartite-type tricarboxylate transporter receptor subunit TctC
MNKGGINPKVQIVNISGQSGNKGAKEAKAAKPDGCTLLAIHESQITTYLAGRVDFTWTAFETVARLTYTPAVLGAHSGVPFSDLKSMVEYAKKNPQNLKVGVTTASTSQFINLMIEEATGATFKYIPYEGTRQRLTAILAKNVDVGEMNILTAKQYIAEGSMKALGIATEKRDPLLPELKTFREQGIDIVYGLYRGVVLPKGASRDAVKFWEAAFKKGLQDPAVKKFLDEKGTWSVFLGAEEYAKFFQKEYAEHEKLAIKIGMYKK